MVKPRSSRTTVQCVDTYCELYRDLFIEVREITVILVQELKAMGFNIKRVLADSLDKEETRKDSGGG
jgi:SRSO17 transposase